MKKKEFKVGEVFKHNFYKLKCVKSKMGMCDGCFFDNGIRCTQSENEYKDIGSCYFEDRDDKTDVIFVKVEE